MHAEEFTLDIRPTFIDELDKTVAYIETKLKNPMAADKLIVDVYDAIDRVLAMPTAPHPVYREPDVAQPYYAIRIRNFTIYYIVRENVMEVRWFRYSPSIAGLSANPEYHTGSPFEN